MGHFLLCPKPHTSSSPIYSANSDTADIMFTVTQAVKDCANCAYEDSSCAHGRYNVVRGLELAFDRVMKDLDVPEGKVCQYTLLLGETEKVCALRTNNFRLFVHINEYICFRI